MWQPSYSSCYTEICIRMGQTMILLEKGNRETTQFSESFDIVRVILENMK